MARNVLSIVLSFVFAFITGCDGNFPFPDIGVGIPNGTDDVVTLIVNPDGVDSIDVELECRRSGAWQNQDQIYDDWPLTATFGGDSDYLFAVDAPIGEWVTCDGTNNNEGQQNPPLFENADDTYVAAYWDYGEPNEIVLDVVWPQNWNESVYRRPIQFYVGSLD